jgi:hypothetical protein
MHFPGMAFRLVASVLSREHGKTRLETGQEGTASRFMLTG